MIGGRSALLSAASGLGYGNWAGNYENVSLLLRNGGPTGLLVPQDESPTPKAITTFGSAGISTTTFKYGDSSLVFDGAGDYLTLASNEAFAFGTGNFTVEAWVYLIALNGPSAASYIADFRSGSTSNFTFGIINSGGNPRMYAFVNGSDVTGTLNASLNAWNHVAFVRNASTITLYLNGTPNGTMSSSFSQSATGIHLASRYTGLTEFFNGNIDDLRITKSVARYVSNFTPPAAELPANATDDPSYNSVSLLMRGYGAPILVPADESPTPKTITAFGNAGISTTTFKYGGSSFVLDGNGDYLSTPYSPESYDWWTSDFTAEAWVYANSWAGWSNTLTSAMLVHGSPTAGIVYWGFGPTAQGVLRFYWYNNSEYSVQTSNIIPTGSWNHIAMVRTSEGIRLFINGKDPVGPRAQPALGTNSTSYPLLVGASAGAIANGYIDDLRITKGVARYTKNFLPPPAELPAI